MMVFNEVFRTQYARFNVVFVISWLMLGACIKRGWGYLASVGGQEAVVMPILWALVALVWLLHAAIRWIGSGD